MKFVYLDEAGISRHEPVTVVAGIIVDGDGQYKALERRIGELIKKHVPPERLTPGFCFHAKELVHGGKTFRRDDYVPEDDPRFKAL